MYGGGCYFYCSPTCSTFFVPDIHAAAPATDGRSFVRRSIHPGASNLQTILLNRGPLALWTTMFSCWIMLPPRPRYLLPPWMWKRPNTHWDLKWCQGKSVLVKVVGLGGSLYMESFFKKWEFIPPALHCISHEPWADWLLCSVLAHSVTMANINIVMCSAPSMFFFLGGGVIILAVHRIWNSLLLCYYVTLACVKKVRMAPVKLLCSWKASSKGGDTYPLLHVIWWDILVHPLPRWVLNQGLLAFNLHIVVMPHKSRI